MFLVVGNSYLLNTDSIVSLSIKEGKSGMKYVEARDTLGVTHILDNNVYRQIDNSEIIEKWKEYLSGTRKEQPKFVKRTDPRIEELANIAEQLYKDGVILDFSTFKNFQNRARDLLIKIKEEKNTVELEDIEWLEKIAWMKYIFLDE